MRQKIRRRTGLWLAVTFAATALLLLLLWPERSHDEPPSPGRRSEPPGAGTVMNRDPTAGEYSPAVDAFASAAWIEGVVREDGTGEPRRATVRLLRQMEPGGWVRGIAAQSGDDGTFRIDGLSIGDRVSLEVIAEGGRMRSHIPSPRLLEQGRNVFVLDLLAGTNINIRVVDEDDRPIPGATVRVATGGNYIPEEIQADSTGQAVLTGLFGHTNLDGWAEGYGSSEHWRHVLRAGEAAEQEVVLRLRPARIVAGEVREAAGAPVADLPLGVYFDTRAEGLRTGLDGRFSSTRVPSGSSISIFVSPSALQQRGFGQLPTLDLDPEQPSDSLEITVHRCSRITGTAVDAGGTPVANVRIEATPSAGQHSGAGRASARADRDGRFEITVPEPGEYAVTGAWSWRYFPGEGMPPVKTAPNAIRSVEVREGETVDVGRVDVSDMVVVKGRMVDAEGRPVRPQERGGNVIVRVEPAEKLRHGLASSLERDGTGQFFVDVPRSAFPIVLRAGDLHSTQTAQPVLLNHPPLPTDAEIVIREDLSRFGELFVRVRDVKGAPVHEFEVYLDGEGTGGVRLDGGWSFYRGRDGGTVNRLRPGTYRMRLCRPGGELKVFGLVTITEGATREVEAMLP